jgi:glutathione S-transferase
MLEYIAEALPGVNLLPGDPFAHYRARATAQFLIALGADVSILGCAKYLVPALNSQPSQALRVRLEAVEPQERRNNWLALLDGVYDEALLSKIRARLSFPLGRLERTLTDSPWLAGPAYSLADIDAFALLQCLPTVVPDVVNERQTPRIMDFLSRMHERKAVKQALTFSRSGKPYEAFVPGSEPSRWG